jgi:hypothetical protein
MEVSVIRRKVTGAALAAIFALGLIGSAPAGAVTSFSNCDAMHKTRLYGVAKSTKAARKQVRTGHYKPYVNLALYRANSSLDADKDGTACEVTK